MRWFDGESEPITSVYCSRPTPTGTTHPTGNRRRHSTFTSVLAWDLASEDAKIASFAQFLLVRLDDHRHLSLGAEA